MILGLGLGMICDGPFEAAANCFFGLQQEFDLQACEIQMEDTLYAAACHLNDADIEVSAGLRASVRILGVHLPFMDLHLLDESGDSSFGQQRLQAALDFAARIRADYSVFHMRYDSSRLDREGRIPVWKDIITDLADRAEERGILFCLENADDMRLLRQLAVFLRLKTPKIKLCLDVGHLYERIYPKNPLYRKILAVNDWYSPFPFIFQHGLSVRGRCGWSNAVEEFRDHIAVVHVHNHDGRSAHRPLRKGHVEFSVLKSMDQLPSIPFVLEADYRRYELDTLHSDLHYLKEMV